MSLNYNGYLHLIS